MTRVAALARLLIRGLGRLWCGLVHCRDGRSWKMLDWGANHQEQWCRRCGHTWRLDPR
jgi:hypothetical protein